MTNDKKIIYKELSYKVVGVAIDVHNQLGSGFLEKVYENAMMELFGQRNINVRQQASLPVYFENKVIGEYFADIMVEDKIILELKACDGFVDAHRAQLINYLKATGVRLGILINFGKKRLEYERLVI